MSRQRRNVTKGGAWKDKPPSDDEEQEEEEEEQGEETTPKQGKASSVAETLAQAELEAQSAIPSEIGRAHV